MPPPRAVTALLVAWLVLAVVAGAAGWVAQLRPPMPQLVLFGVTATILALGAAWPTLRRWALTVDPRWLVAFHLTRFVGGYFLVLYGRGELPYGFAVPGGIGDLVVALSAVALLLGVSPHTRRGRIAYLVWNVVGLIDILGVVASAAREGLRDPASLDALLRLPLSLLPTFVVPLIIATHLLLFVRLAPPQEVVN